MTYDIVIKNLVKEYGSVKALKGIDLSIPSGASFGLLGPNGAGKTTLFSLLANFLKPTSGSIEILGSTLTDYSNNYGRIGALPQDSLLYRHQTIYAQLFYFSRMLGFGKKEAKEEVEHVLEMVSLIDKRHAKVSALSHGMNKRLGIAQALLGSPQIILLDEPLAGLDPPLAKSIRELIMSFQEDKTLIISSHNLHEIEEICDYIAILHEGEIKVSDKLTHVVGQHTVATYFLEYEPDLSQLRKRADIMSMHYNEGNNSLHITYDHDLIKLTDLNNLVFDMVRTQGCGLLSISTGNSLEESFLKYIQR